MKRLVGPQGIIFGRPCQLRTRNEVPLPLVREACSVSPGESVGREAGEAVGQPPAADELNG